MTLQVFQVLLLCALLLGARPGFAIDTDPKLADPVQQATYERLTHEVRCLVCQNQTIGDSSAPLAADLRREIRQMIEAGRSEEEIKLFLLERYGDFVLYKPQFKASTAALWLAPLLLLLVGGLGLGRIIRRRAALPVPADDEQAGYDPADAGNRTAGGGKRVSR
ncbi:MAG: cytochrome c-type biogenesis protein CcmH [Gammaproteobacteria bacterium]|nr:cytochrome c-type biogenesis protein CcmH [Gammaproteobacteria bacterium]